MVLPCLAIILCFPGKLCFWEVEFWELKLLFKFNIHIPLVSECIFADSKQRTVLMQHRGNRNKEKFVFPLSFPPTLETDLSKRQLTQIVYSSNMFAACVRHSVSLHSQKKRLWHCLQGSVIKCCWCKQFPGCIFPSRKSLASFPSFPALA